MGIGGFMFFTVVIFYLYTTIKALEGTLEKERVRRMTAIESMDKILGRLDQLQASVTSAAEPA